MPTNIVKSDFPPLEQWEEMEIVEDIGTADEHADPFYRWNNYGIEVHEDGLCQAYVIIQDPEEGEIPKMVSEGFSSPEAVIEFFKNTEGEKALTEGEGNAPEMEGEPAPEEGVAEEEPEEKAEAEKEPVPEKKGDDKKDDKTEDEKKDEKKDVKKSDVAKVGEDPLAPTPTPDGSNGDVANKDPSGTNVPHATIGQTDADEPKIPGEKKDDGSFACSDAEEPEPLGDYPVIKSYAEMRAEWEESHREYNPPATFVPGRTQKTMQKTQCKEYSDKSREYPVDKIDKNPEQRKAYKSSVTHPNPHPIGGVRKSVEFGSIPSWEDLKAGYDFVAPATSPVAKGAMIPSTDEQIAGRAGDNIDSNNPEAVAEAEAPAEGEASAEDIEKLAQEIADAIGIPVEKVMELAQTEEGLAQLENMFAEANGAGAPAEGEVPAEGEAPVEEAEPAVDSDTADDGQKRISLQSEPEDTL